MSKVICCYINIFDRNVTIFDMEENNPEDTHTLGVIELNEDIITIIDVNKILNI